MTFAHRSWRLALVTGMVALGALAAAPAIAADHAVAIVEKTFAPAEVAVAVGDTVTWTVTKGINEPHTVTSGTPTGTGKGAEFDSQKDDPGLAKLKTDGGTFSFTFKAAGTFDYFCVIHPTMIGKVVVTAAGETPGGGEGEAHAPVAPERKLLAGVVLVVTLVVLFGAAWFWRRMNPA